MDDSHAPISYVDSVGKPLIGTNLYTYTGNHPVNRIDSSGLQYFNPYDLPPEFRTSYDDIRNLWHGRRCYLAACHRKGRIERHVKTNGARLILEG
jgi:hypothetical protein